MNRSRLATSVLTLTLGLICSFGDSQPAIAQQPQTPTTESGQSKPEQTVSLSALRVKGLAALQQGNYQSALSAADAMVKQFPDDPNAMRLSADIYLRSGKVEQAARLFDRYLESEPEQMRSLWQRGIALYLIGDYKRAAKQFEEHRLVNPHDVENAAWHFLCVAKSESFAKARELILPAPNDPRIPMEEIHQLLKTGDTDAVNESVIGTPADSRARADAEFYGDFYLGLYADAKGDREQAQVLLTRTAKGAPYHYMGDVARVYAKHLSK